MRKKKLILKMERSRLFLVPECHDQWIKNSVNLKMLMKR